MNLHHHPVIDDRHHTSRTHFSDNQGLIFLPGGPGSHRLILPDLI